MELPQKRAFDGTDDLIGKMPRGDYVDADGQGLDQWMCPKCANLNYGSRLVCNMRNCGQPRSEQPWFCPGCGNENRATLMFCNMRKCQLARPGLTAPALRQAVAQAQMSGSPSVSQGAAQLQAPASASASDAKLGEPGSWTCPGCGNRNYAGRLVCNSKKCGIPKPVEFGGYTAPMSTMAGVAAQVQNFGFTGVAGYQTGGMVGTIPGYPTGGLPGSLVGVPGVFGHYMNLIGVQGGFQQQPQQVSQQGSVPVGSWACTACGNVNFPTRVVCNGKKCGQPRQGVDPGYDGSAPMPPHRANQPPPEGSWTCLSCANVNYPTRTSCNRRDCGTPRPV